MNKQTKIAFAVFFFLLGLGVVDLSKLVYEKLTFEVRMKEEAAHNLQLKNWNETTAGAAVRLGIMAPCLVKDTFNVSDGREVSCVEFTNKIKSGEITF